jgi:hypothetical protein
LTSTWRRRGGWDEADSGRNTLNCVEAGLLAIVEEEISTVLLNMEALGQEHPIPAPKIAAKE